MDLATWDDIGIMETGTGYSMAHEFFTDSEERVFYRVREHHFGFLTLPQPDKTLLKEDGVCFAFDLSYVSQMPAKICISKRVTAGAWELIGTLTDFATLKGVKTVRGSSVWIPAAEEVSEGENYFEGKAVALNASGGTLIEATRQITIVPNRPPSVLITDYSTTPEVGGTDAGTMSFTTEVSDPDEILGDEVTRVEYYDRGRLIGTDYTAPFGAAPSAGRWDDPRDDYGIVNVRGLHLFYPNALLAGLHEITAKAYDTRGGVGETAPDDPETPENEAFAVTINGSNARPNLNIAGPDFYEVRQPGGNLQMNYSIQDSDGLADVAGGLIPSTLFQGAPGLHGMNSTSGTITFSMQNWQPGAHTLMATAHDFGGDGILGGTEEPSAKSYETAFHIRIDKSAEFVTAPDMAQLIADPATAPVPAGALNMVRFYGAYAASQPYTNGTAAGLDASTFPASARRMDSGVLLSTGQVASWNGTTRVALWDDNDSDTNTSKQWFTPGDKVIHERIAGNYSRDAATLEFDVDCLQSTADGLHSQLEMELQFGSEAYPERIGDPDGLAYDALAVTVDGTLISLVPDGGAPISAKSIHPVIPASQNNQWPDNPTLMALRDHLYLDDEGEITAAANSTTQVEYDGMTVRLRLHAFVSPGIHKVRISIADRDFPNTYSFNQAQNDSGVFIREGSLRTIAPTP